MQTKVHISIPCMGDVKAETVGSLLSFAKNTQLDYSIEIQKNTYIHYARNKAVWEAVNHHATHLMFIDADMKFPKDGIEKLLSDQKDIVGGLYFGRVAPFPVFKVKHPSKNALSNPIDVPYEPVFEAEAVGTGFLLINMDVFKIMSPPFFFHTEPPTFGMLPQPFPNNEIGEDMAFCLKAKEAGFTTYVDQSFELGHVGEKVYTRSEYKEWVEKEKELMKKELMEQHNNVIQ